MLRFVADSPARLHGPSSTDGPEGWNGSPGAGRSTNKRPHDDVSAAMPPSTSDRTTVTATRYIEMGDGHVLVLVMQCMARIHCGAAYSRT
jgi:hypothetical protein